jgi:cellulose synthase operon protein C
LSVLKFESEEALRFTITSGLVPETVVAGAARTWRDASGGIVIAPETAVPPDAMKKLAAAGVARLPASTSSKNATSVGSWAELLGVVRGEPVDDDMGQVLFVVPEGASMIDLAGELLRLGCDRLEWRVERGVYLVRVAEPPYYTLLRAIDGVHGVSAYVASPRGQERVWVELGCEHPLARFLRPDAGSVLLVSGGPKGESVFTTLPEGSFEDIYSLVDLRVPAGAETKKTRAVTETQPPRLGVTLRLARAASSEAPSLWVIRDNAIQKVEKLLASLPEEMTRGLLFAACKDGDETIVVVRTRPGTRGNVEIDGESYRSHASIASLYLPCDATLEPPLRRDRVRDLLAPDPDDVVWLRPLGGGRFQVEQASDNVFQPLSDWVEYVIDTNAAALVPWVKSTTFDFDAFVGIDSTFEVRRDADEPEAPRKKKARAEAASAAAPTPRTVTARAVQERAPVRATLNTARIDPNKVAEELATVEKEFLALDAPADAPERSELWERMAPLNVSLQRAQDAALCWARVVWEAKPEAAAPAVQAWAEAEQTLLRGVSMKTLLALDTPSRDHVRALSVLLQQDDASVGDLAHDASLWLDRHDHLIDIRTAWLGRVALSRISGGDRLGLARARDRLLTTIHRGLSLDRDVPSFMRRAGAGRDAAQIDVLARKLDALLETYEKTKRKRSATEADTKLTNAYVRFIVAYGSARLGRSERAVHLRDTAVRVLPADPIHDLLSRGYVARIAQALEGLPAETPLPPPISAGLDGLAKLDRYKVDRVRQCSKVLEPQERLDPITAFQRGEADPRGPEFAGLRGETDRAKIESRVAAIMKQARASVPEERARLYDGVMDFFPQLPHERAVSHIEALLKELADIAAPRRAALLEEALMLAGHLGEERLARTIFGVLEPLVANAPPDEAAAIAPLASGMLRTLRRFGLRDEAQRLLGALQRAATGTATVHLIARLHTAAALSYLGEVDRARPVFEEALTALSAERPLPERLQLTRALTRALGTAPINYAIAGLDALQKRLDVVTDSFNTNTHVCLSVVDYMESLVLGYASEDLAIDQVARRFLDEDEYLVRRRIHRDLSR